MYFVDEEDEAIISEKVTIGYVIYDEYTKDYLTDFDEKNTLLWAWGRIDFEENRPFIFKNNTSAKKAVSLIKRTFKKEGESAYDTFQIKKVKNTITEIVRNTIEFI